MAPTVIGGMSLATVEAYSKWSNVLQLAVGIMSMLAYVTILVVQTRFFPIQANAASPPLPSPLHCSSHSLRPMTLLASL